MTEEFFWKTKNGKRIKPSEMTDSHIINVLRSLCRQMDIACQQMQYLLSNEALESDIDCLSLDEAIQQNVKKRKRLTKAINAIGNEAVKRNLKDNCIEE